MVLDSSYLCSSVEHQLSPNHSLAQSKRFLPEYSDVPYLNVDSLPDLHSAVGDANSSVVAVDGHHGVVGDDRSERELHWHQTYTSFLPDVAL